MELSQMACRTPTRSELASLPGPAPACRADKTGDLAHLLMSPRTKKQLLEVISVLLDQLYFHQTEEGGRKRASELEERTPRGERELNKEGKRRKRDGDENKAGKRKRKADTCVNCHVTRYFDVCADSPACQGCFTHKEGTSEQDGEVNREIDGHHLLGPCIICHCHCCQNTDCCFSPLNVIANDVGYVPNATNVFSCGVWYRAQVNSVPALGNEPRYSRAQVFLYEEHNERVQTWRDRQANGEGLVSESTPFSITLSLPSIALPLSSSVSVSLGSASGIKKGMGGCDSQQNPLNLALPHTSQSTGEFLIHRRAQSC
ncbi:hypothetical protein F7725_025069 [Dissostichus mawsoni]|uniref:Uncharacterized protein n=1 Tax=Dissostichus mawsoni TaxID=36200 RepID=A0A7J5XA39_DISMA|nr:hypothetical protein F7725_025069 [Dissostichus mawsoni]